MSGRNLAVVFTSLLFSLSVSAVDLEHSVSGDDEIENTLETSKVSGNSPYLVEGESSDNVEKSKPNGEDYIFNHGVKEVSGKNNKRYKDFGYTMPGSAEKQENYIELDKLKIAKDFRRAGTAGFNITFVKNDFDYTSDNDVINRTVGTGYKSVKGGTILFRNDQYIFKTDYLNAHWSIGAGVGYNSGRGIFIDGTRSDTTFKLWEVPIDAGLGLEIPLYSWFKIAGTGGPSVMGLMQNRSDIQRGEKGKRKIQVSPGYFANAQFKINLTGFSDDMAYELFSSSDITNLFLNLEIRHQKYASFQDAIEISGTSFGLGFTFEYL